MEDWKLYERFVAELMSEKSNDELTVIPNAKLKGAISGVPRQIDVLIDARWGEDVTRRVIIDAKRHRRKIDVKDVESFLSMMVDCRAQHGIIVCTNGYTPAALKRAQNAITIKLVPLDDLEKIDLSTWDSCLGSCHSSKRKRAESGLILWDGHFGLAVGGSPMSIVAVGKCDVCHNFHIWCWDCGSKFALGDDDMQKCSCDWFWLTAVEEEDANDEQIESIMAVHLYQVLLPQALSYMSSPLPKGTIQVTQASFQKSSDNPGGAHVLWGETPLGANVPVAGILPVDRRPLR